MGERIPYLIKKNVTFRVMVKVKNWFNICQHFIFIHPHPSIRPSVLPSTHRSVYSYIHSLTHSLICLFSVRRCSSLKAPRFGFIYPYMCTSFPVSGTVCNLECRSGFIGNGGVNEMRCGKDGKWSTDQSLILQCLGTMFCYLFLRPGCSVSYIGRKTFLSTYTVPSFALSFSDLSKELKLYEECSLG